MPYQQVTLATLQTRMVERWDSSVFWTNEEARLALNEALRLYNLFTGFWKKRVVIPTVPVAPNGVGLYYLTDTQLSVNLRMTLNDLPMTLGAVEEYNLARPNWRAEQTDTGEDVPTRPMVYLPVGLRRFAIWPKDATGGNSLGVDGVTVTPVLVNGGDFVDLGQEEELALTSEALHIAAFKEGGVRWKATLPLHRHFLGACVDKNTRLATSSFFREFLGLDRQKDYRPIRGATSRPLPPQIATGGQ